MKSPVRLWGDLLGTFPHPLGGQLTPQKAQQKAERHIPSLGVRRRMMYDWIYSMTDMGKGIHHGLKAGVSLEYKHPVKHGMLEKHSIHWESICRLSTSCSVV